MKHISLYSIRSLKPNKMLVRLVDRIINDILSRLSVNLAPISCNGTLPSPVGLGRTILDELLDGKLWATPKRRTPHRKIWARRYGDDNWRFGTKLWKPNKNIVTCMECGSFHEYHTICRTCFEKISKKSKELVQEKDRARPLWFDANLSQTDANPSKLINSPPKVFDNRIIRLKKS